MNFAISKRGAKAGPDHLGVQVDSEEELAGLRRQIAQADIPALEQSGAACCYARSDKCWITDPQGTAWESFRKLDTIPLFGSDARSGSGPEAACCGPAAGAQGSMADSATKSSCCG